MGRLRQTIAGCSIRKDSTVYLIIEAVITEILGINAHKALDGKTGIVTLDL